LNYLPFSAPKPPSGWKADSKLPVEHFRQHPDIHQPFNEWSEDQRIHIVGVYNNPFRWRKRRELFNDWRRHMLNSPNVELYVVELAYGDRPHEVTDPDQWQNDIQLRTDCEMWHKENLINVGVQRFPSGWKYGGYCDTDFTFTRHDWALEAIHMLQHHQFVQLFSAYADLTGETSTSWSGHRPYRMNSSFAWNFTKQDEFKAARAHKLTAENCYGLPQRIRSEVFPFGLAPGATGGAWAWRRQAFNIVGGLLDTCILGSGDWHMAFGLIGRYGFDVETERGRNTIGHTKTVEQWMARAAKLEQHPGKNAIGCVDNFAVHHFHGSKLARAYGERWQILKKHAFDPPGDLTKDWQGVYRWTGNKPGLRDDVRRYFLNRNEDDTSVGPSERPMV
jgi:hypothetical protein